MLLNCDWQTDAIKISRSTHSRFCRLNRCVVGFFLPALFLLKKIYCRSTCIFYIVAFLTLAAWLLLQPWCISAACQRKTLTFAISSWLIWKTITLCVLWWDQVQLYFVLALKDYSYWLQSCIQSQPPATDQRAFASKRCLFLSTNGDLCIRVRQPLLPIDILISGKLGLKWSWRRFTESLHPA